MKRTSRLSTRHSFTDAIELQENEESQDTSIVATNVNVCISKTIQIPDMFRVDRCHRLPEYGPRILFFSGGSALKELSSVLKEYTHNSIHLITPFDSGGSSAEIRKAFNMLSVGDLRNRLMALADTSPYNNPHVIKLFSHRLDKVDDGLAKHEFQQILEGKHYLARKVSMPMRSLFLSHLKWFAQRVPVDTFDWKGASIGNLIITGCFLEHDDDIVTALYLIWKLLGVKGVCRPLSGANLHIRTFYKDGSVQVGQHKMGKSDKLKKIVNLDFVTCLSVEEEDQQPSQLSQIDVVSSKYVSSVADVICFPMGSFFGSIIVNLLSRGVGQAIVKNHCPKIYIPNTGIDPEMYGYTLLECVQCIIDLVQNDCLDGSTSDDDAEGDSEGEDGNNKTTSTTPPDISDIINFVLVDTRHCSYCVPTDIDEIQKLGITVIDVPLVDDASQEAATSDELNAKSSYLDSTKVAEVLLTLGC